MYPLPDADTPTSFMDEINTPSNRCNAMRTISTPSQSRSAARQLLRPIRRVIWQRLPIKAIELLGDWGRGLHYY